MTSSFSTASQLSCSVSISSLRSSFCSGESLAIQACLSNLLGAVSGAVGEDEGWDNPFPQVDELLGLTLGCPKKDVMDPFVLGCFFAESLIASAALRLSDILECMVRVAVAASHL